MKDDIVCPRRQQNLILFSQMTEFLNNFITAGDLVRFEKHGIPDVCIRDIIAGKG
jgi:hypothetical protein